MAKAGDEHTVELEIDGHTVGDHPSRTRCSSPTRGDTKLDLVMLLPARRRAVDAPDGRPAGAAAALPQRRRRARRSSRSGSPTPRRSGCRPRSSRTPNGTDVAGAGDRRPRPPHLGGEHRLPRLPLVADAGRTTRSTATSCASTSTPGRARPSRWPRRPPTLLHELLDELGVRGYIKTTGNRGLHVYVRLRAAVGLHRRALGRRRRGPRAGAPPARAGHRVVVEGGARASGSSSTSTRTPRTRRCSPRGRCAPIRTPRCRARSSGTSSPASVRTT